jgi:hypothetical protein
LSPPPEQALPKLSVFTIASHSASECLMAIRALSRQTVRTDLEVILVSPNMDGVAPQEFDQFGSWHWLKMPVVRQAGLAMAEAARVARAPYVTYAEEHAQFRDNWAERLIAAHGRGYDAVGFAMDNANPATLVSWAHLYGQFGPVVHPVTPGESNVLAGHHASYSKELLIGYGPLAAAMLEDEAALHLDLRRRGIRMFIAGDAVSKHVNLSSLTAYMRLDYLGQRSFAATRASAGKWSWSKRAAFVAATPLIPFVRLRRILHHIWRSGRQRELMPQILFPISLALMAGAWGEMLGYLIGGGDSAEHKIPLELQREEYLAAQDDWSKSAQLERDEDAKSH